MPCQVNPCFPAGPFPIIVRCPPKLTVAQVGHSRTLADFLAFLHARAELFVNHLCGQYTLRIVAEVAAPRQVLKLFCDGSYCSRID